MSNLIGTRSSLIVPAGVTTISNTVLANVTNMVQAVAKNSQWSFRFLIPFSVGATGGIKFQVLAPAAPTLFLLTWRLFQFGTPGTLLDTAVQTSSTAFSNAAAGAGTNYMEAFLQLINGSTAGNVALQFAQNSSVAATLTILQGGWCDVIQY
jgi:hypothetical protein